MSPHPPSNHALYYGDNLDVLRKKISDETVDLCYIDPPFNSKRNYNQIYNNIGSEDPALAQAFIDTWVWDTRANEGFAEILANEKGRFSTQTVDLLKGLHLVLKKGSLFAYLVNMTLRITEIHRVLKPTGSFYLHCDPTASHYLKLILDSIFCSQGGDFKNEIIWHYSGWNSRLKDKFNSRHDIILFYTKGKKQRFNSFALPWSSVEEYVKVRKQKVLTDDFGGKYVLSDAGGGQRVERYLEDAMKYGKPVDDVWNIDKLNNSSKERLGYPTQKPEALLDRIIQASTNEGDVVLDAYCGCGTTISVAERLKRKWIGIDITYQSISLILRRLEGQYGKEFVANIIPDGIPRDMDAARNLAHKQDDRLRKEFEKWAILTYTNNRAIINDKKGGDQGIDGTAFFLTAKDENAKIVFQVKSGTVGRGDISKLNNDRTREGAESAVFLTLQPPTQGMKSEASSAGIYKHDLMNRTYPRIQIVTIAEVLEQQKRLDIPMSLEVLKTAQTVSLNNAQPQLFTDV